MDSRILTPIPTPPSQRWREIRLLYLPRVTFAVAVVAVAFLWNGSISSSTMVAEVEVLGSDVRAAQAGVIASLNVTVNQKVRAGEVIGQIVAANSRLLDARLTVIRAEVGMLTATMAGATDKQRMALDMEKLQLDWMSHRVDRVALQGKLQQAESDLARGEPLNRSGLITQEAYEQLKINRDSLVAQVAEKNLLIARLDPAVRKVNAADPQAAGLSGDSALAAAIKVQETKLRLAEEELAPTPLIAPIDGVVAAILHRAGETVMAGDAVLRVTAPKAQRLSGFLRQPLPFEPKPGMEAEIRTRGTPMKIGATKIINVGVAHEVIPPTVLAALRLPPTPAPETALRVEFALPAGLDLRPGEHVDVTLR